jgi:hypothetical protein
MSLRKSVRSPCRRDELLELEQRLLDRSVRGSPQAVMPMLHRDFMEFGSSGRVYTKEMMVQMMVREHPRRRGSAISTSVHNRLFDSYLP